MNVSVETSQVRVVKGSTYWWGEQIFTHHNISIDWKPICSLLFHPGFYHSLSLPSSSSPPVWGSIPQLSHLFQCFLAMATMEKNAFLFWFCSECHASPCAVNRTFIFCEKCVLVAAWRAQRTHLNKVCVFLLWPLCTLCSIYLLHYMLKQKVCLLPVSQQQ